ncbi:MAG: hypothetical protein EZS28_052771 [Streblomastix strix]|uniref:Uncharacterized protein n=1 Tax=Streblomastix strix TaxID=222440 RepID=A0A5J4RVY1_9EUKA|nr:MAG: hypothetical protein EZS28_052771 [Streblomastix strix]
MDIRPRTCRFLVGDREQPIFIQNLPRAIKFCAWRIHKDSFFEVVFLRRLSDAVARGTVNSHAIIWGE